MKKPEIDLGRCTLCGVCTAVCPEVFTVSEAVFITVTELDCYPDAAVNEAVKNCPADCIEWTEAA